MKKRKGLNLLDNKEELRLQVYLSHCGVASRRASEQIILSGRVSVNGVKVDQLGIKVKPDDVVCVDGKTIQFENEKRYVLLNKPAGYVCSSADEKGRLEAYSLIKNNYTERLYNVGRLDMMSSGAIIFTNDGKACAYLEHPSSQIEKEYVITTLFPFNNDVLEAFMKGIRIEGVFYKAKDVSRLGKCKIRIVLIEGKNREIRRVLSHFEIKIKTLIRVRIGTVKLGDLKEGESRELSPQEISSLLSH
ncbi:MAG: pseudouridine synthase [Treponema sp.]